MSPARRVAKGRLIAFEGSDASGRTLQARLLRRWLLARGIPVALIAWNGRPGPNPPAQRPAAGSLVRASTFADRFRDLIAVQLASGRVVIADGYAYGGLARDLAHGCDPHLAREMYDFAPRPSLTFYCEPAPSTPEPGPLEARVHRAYAVLDREFCFHRLAGQRAVIDAQRDVRAAVGRLLTGGQPLPLSLPQPARTRARSGR